MGETPVFRRILVDIGVERQYGDDFVLVLFELVQPGLDPHATPLEILFHSNAGTGTRSRIFNRPMMSTSLVSHRSLFIHPKPIGTLRRLYRGTLHSASCTLNLPRTDWVRSTEPSWVRFCERREPMTVRRPRPHGAGRQPNVPIVSVNFCGTLCGTDSTLVI